MRRYSTHAVFDREVMEELEKLHEKKVEDPGGKLG